MKINYDEFKKVEITIGKIISAEKMPNADKLLILKVNFGLKPTEISVVQPTEISTDASTVPVEPVKVPDIRQIVSGISAFFPEPEKLIGTQCAFVTNLEPRMIRGYESNGMILAVGGENGEPFSLFRMGDEILPGAQAR